MSFFREIATRLGKSNAIEIFHEGLQYNSDNPDLALGLRQAREKFGEVESAGSSSMVCNFTLVYYGLGDRFMLTSETDRSID